MMRINWRHMRKNGDNDKMNLLDTQGGTPEKEMCFVLWEDDQIRIEKIVSYGQTTPPDYTYCQQEAEWVSVLQGYGVLYFPDTHTEEKLGPGAYRMIPAGERHRVIYTSKPCVWLCVFEKQRGAENE